ncbi:hypothetical protein LUZ60_015222 [Juncus effusus]|nr:hypothetical protein LUZ60_015222 [Juncus effusus]
MEGITLAKKWLVIMAVISIASLTSAQEPPSSPPSLPCVAELAACSAFYYNTTLTPTPECCKPLENALKTEVPCLCQVFTNPAIQKQLGIDLKSGMALFQRCNITGATESMCTAPPPGAPPKSAPAGNGAVYGARWIGFSGFFTVLLFVFSFMA